MTEKIYTPQYRKFLNTDHHDMRFMVNMFHHIKEAVNDLKWGIYHTLRIIPNAIRNYLDKRKTITRNTNYDPDFTNISEFIMDINPLICDTFLALDHKELFDFQYVHVASTLLYQEGFEFIQLTYLDQEHFDFIL